MATQMVAGDMQCPSVPLRSEVSTAVPMYVASIDGRPREQPGGTLRLQCNDRLLDSSLPSRQLSACVAKPNSSSLVHLKVQVVLHHQQRPTMTSDEGDRRHVCTACPTRKGACGLVRDVPIWGPPVLDRNRVVGWFCGSRKSQPPRRDRDMCEFTALSSHGAVTPPGAGRFIPCFCFYP
jgi:hypothetical protein